MVYLNQFLGTNNMTQFNDSIENENPLGGIIIKGIRCTLKVKKQQPKISKFVKSILRDNTKLRLEFEFNQEIKSTGVNELTQSSNKQDEKNGSWQENMVFTVSSSSYQSMMNTDLLIRCWDPTIKGRIGCIGEAKQNLAYHEQFSREETYCELDLGYSDSIIVSFYVYFFSNDPPSSLMREFDDPNIRGRNIGIILIKKIQLKCDKAVGPVGYLEFGLEREKSSHSTKKYWNILNSELKYIVSLDFIARHDELFIKFYYGSSGSVAKTKFHIGPAAATEILWPLLEAGESVDVGEYMLLEHGLCVGKIRFEISCHRSLNSKKFFSMCSQYLKKTSRDFDIDNKTNATKSSGSPTTTISSINHTNIQIQTNQIIQSRTIPPTSPIIQSRTIPPTSLTNIQTQINPNIQTQINPNIQTNLVNPNIQTNLINPNIQTNLFNPNIQTNPINPNIQANLGNPNIQTNLINPNIQTNPINPIIQTNPNISSPLNLISPINLTNPINQINQSIYPFQNQNDINPLLLRKSSSTSSYARSPVSSHPSSQQDYESFTQGMVGVGGGGGGGGGVGVGVRVGGDGGGDGGGGYNKDIREKVHRTPSSRSDCSYESRSESSFHEYSSEDPTNNPNSNNDNQVRTSGLSRSNENDINQERYSSQSKSQAPSSISQASSINQLPSRSNSNRSNQTVSSQNSRSNILSSSSLSKKKNSHFTPKTICGDRYMITTPVVNNNYYIFKSLTRTSSDKSTSSQSSYKTPTTTSTTSSTVGHSNYNYNRNVCKYFKGHLKKIPEKLIICKLHNNHSNFNNEVLFLRKFMKSQLTIKLFDIEMYFDENEFFDNTAIEIGSVAGSNDEFIDDNDHELRLLRQQQQQLKDLKESKLSSLIITEYYGENLDTNLNKFNNEKELFFLFRNICEKVKSLHDRKVVHSSLNPSNIICKETNPYKLRICDFENARNIGDLVYSAFRTSTYFSNNSHSPITFQSLNPIKTNYPSDDTMSSHDISDNNNIQVKVQVVTSTIVTSDDDNNHYQHNDIPNGDLTYQSNNICDATSTTTIISSPSSPSPPSPPPSLHINTNNLQHQLTSQNLQKNIPQFSIGFSAPEILLPQKLLLNPKSISSKLITFLENIKAKKSIDVFSLGSILYYLCTKKLLYESIEELERLVREKKSKRRKTDSNNNNNNNDDDDDDNNNNQDFKDYEINSLFKDNDGVISNEDIKEVICMCLKIDDDERWSIDDILASKFMNWNL
ncbi:hypothetical protein Glove_61g7 [Diversispora epigaea]|uniref:Protein kinase domain-containing protein n=1 Tax=Diversispora epigaea TaxID=1348612 RepID=A0A397JIC8_9GLOM|nr:hypothetical protein Glove_61g7 [Diversispora epigaea]